MPQSLQRDRGQQRYSWTEINPTDVKFVSEDESLGSGAFSIVRPARWKGASVAVKLMKDSNSASPDTIHDLRKEVRVHERLHHEFITHLYGACTMKPNLWLVMEYARNGSLHEYLHRSGKLLDYPLQIAFLLDIARGMYFLHDQGILHRDLKSSNVLVFDNDRLKLCDFGLAKLKEGSMNTAGSVATRGFTTMTGGIKGTVAWMAPEVLQGERATEKSDLYR